MAAVFDIDTEFRARAIGSIDAGLATIETAVAALGASDKIEQLQRAQRRLAAVEALVLAEHITDDGNTRGAAKLLGNGRTSRAEQRKRTKRAKTIGKNTQLADKMANDELSEEQVDLIADAADRSDGAAATDEALIDDIAAADPDTGRNIRDEWLANRATADGTQTEHDRQRALRRHHPYASKKNGLDASLLEGDSVSHRAIVEAIRDRSKEIYRRDGGRDLPASAHPRTRSQREYDAAYELICGVTTNPDGTTRPATQSATGSAAGSAARPRVVIGLTLDKFLGRDPATIARQIGLGVIPDSVLANYAEHAAIFTALFDRQGEPLWFARLRRNATDTQYVALVLRDKGCVQCGASHTECDVHHRIPWNAPAKGGTDLGDLVLLCRHCHTTLHADLQTLYRHPSTRRWCTRPATADETPPPRPQHNRPQRE